MLSDNSLDTIMSQTSWEFGRVDGEIFVVVAFEGLNFEVNEISSFL